MSDSPVVKLNLSKEVIDRQPPQVRRAIAEQNAWTNAHYPSVDEQEEEKGE